MKIFWLVALLAAAPARAQEKQLQFQNIVVKPGDTIFTIASEHLKDPTLWPELLKYNKLPSSDPTVALPGMTLRVPKVILREAAAAALTMISRRVLYRAKGTAEWADGKQGQNLYREDGVRTGEASRANMRFSNGKELRLEQNSMAIIRPQGEDTSDLQLERGDVKAVRVTVRTPSAHIVPRDKDTSYDAQVTPDLSTEVEVYTGMANVEAAGKVVSVPSGYSVTVPKGRAPGVPKKVEASVLAARAPSAPSGDAAPAVNTDFGALPIDRHASRFGVPLSGYRVQAALDETFSKVIWENVYDIDEKIELRRAALKPGVYWWRTAPVDLMGVTGKFTAGKQISVPAR